MALHTSVGKGVGEGCRRGRGRVEGQVARGGQGTHLLS